MKLIHYQLLEQWKGKLEEVVLRFPLTIVMSLFACIATIYLNHFVRSNGDFTGVQYFLAIYPVSAMVLSLMLHLWTEEWTNRSRGWLASLILHLLWVGLCIYWALHYPPSIGHSIAFGVCIGSMLLGWTTLPFLQKNEDVAAINFLMRLFRSCLISASITLALFLSLLFLLQSFVFLFDIHIFDYIFLDVFIVCALILGSIIVLIQLPNGKEKFSNTNWLQNRFGNGLIHFLLLPLTAVYALTLYAYLIKILYTWTLPNGWVSWLVSALVFLMVVTEIFLYPSSGQNKSKRLDNIVVIWLPFVVLPLLVLMSVGIWQRFADYGVTISRIYLLIFNLWCYIVCIGLIWVRSQRVMWIIWSFSFVSLLVSIFPVNIASFTRNQLQRDIKFLLDNHGKPHLPMDAKTYEKVLNQAGPRAGRSLDSKLYYLWHTYEDASIYAFLQKNVQPLGYDINGFYPKEKGMNSDHVEQSINFEPTINDQTINIPSDYRYVKHYVINKLMSVSLDGDSLDIIVDYASGKDSIVEHFHTQLSKLIAKIYNNNNSPIILQNGHSKLVIISLNLKYTTLVTDFNCECYLFVR